MTDLSTYWKDYDPETGVGDPSTPLAAQTLNEWGAGVEQIRADAENFRNQAQEAAEQAEAPTDAMVASVVANPSSDAHAAVAGVIDAKSPTVSVVTFGAVGDGVADDTAAIQAAIDAAETFGLATYLPPGRFLITDTLVLKSGTTLRGAGRGSTVIDATGLGAALGAGRTAITALGARAGTSNSITVAVARGAKSVTVVDATGLSVGDRVLLSSDDTFHTTAALRKGEIKRIEAISGSTVTFEDATYDSYATNPTLTRYSTWLSTITIESLTLEGTNVDNMERGVYIYGADDVTVRDCTFNYLDWNAVNLRDVVNFKVTGNTFTCVPWVDNGPNYYGFVVENASAHGVFAHNHGTLCRHLFTTGYTVTQPGVTRFVEVIGNVDTYSQSASFDTHNGSELVTFMGNTSSFSTANGINVESRQTNVIGNVVVGFATIGVYLRDGLADCTISGNRITSSAADTTGMWLRRTGTAYPSRIEVTGNTMFATSIGIRLDEIRVAGVSNNVISPLSGQAIRATTCQDLRVQGNSATSGAHAIYLDNCLRTLVSNNDAGTCTVGVAAVNGGDHTLVLGNNLTRCTTPVTGLAGTFKVAHNLGVADHNA